ncbi:hypothetical protein FQZ97_971090 [compost metagenome]
MQPSDALRTLAAGGDIRDHQRRGVAGENRRIAKHLFQGAEQLALDLDVLDHRLNGQVAAFQLLDPAAGGDAPDDLGALLRAVAPLAHGLVDQPGDELDGLLRRAFGGIEAAHRMAGLGEQLHDATAHGAGADHGDALDGAHAYFPV